MRVSAVMQLWSLRTTFPHVNCARQEVLQQLAAQLNPDICFSPFQLSVIADEVSMPSVTESDRPR